VLQDTIIWGNTAVSNGNQIYHSASSSVITLVYCDYDNGTNDVEGVGTVNEAGVCIYSDPLFVTGPKGDYYLDHTTPSPCVDAGSGSAANLGLDTKTTRTDSATDTGFVDIGYHYDP
jgi:hypothetical protein